MKKITTLTFFIIVSLSAFSQNKSWVNVMHAKGAGSAFARSEIYEDNKGNIYTSTRNDGAGFVINHQAGTDTFSSPMQGSGVIAKTSSAGKLIWSYELVEKGVIADCLIESICVLDNHKVLATGVFYGDVDFDADPNDSTILRADGGDIFMLCLDSSGKFLWAKSFGSTQEDAAFSIATDGKKAIFISGMFSGTVNFNPNGKLELTGSGDGFIAKYDDDGNFYFVRKFENAYLGGLTYSQNRLRFSGLFFGKNSDLNGTKLSAVTQDPVFGELNAINGANVFLRQLKTSDLGVVGSVAYGDKYIAVTGYFKGSIDIDPGTGTYLLSATGQLDYYLALYNLNGVLVKGFSFGGQNGRVETGSIQFLDSNNLMLLGNWINEVDFDPSGSTHKKNATTWSVFLAKYNNDLNLESIETIEGNASILSRDFHIGLDKGFYLSITPYDSMCVKIRDSTLCLQSPSSGPYHVLVKITNCTAINVEYGINACEPIYSPSGIYLWNTSGIYYDTLHSKQGCDTLLKVLLNIEAIDTSVTQTTNTLSAQETTATYRWLDCNKGYSFISGTTAQTFVATATGSYAIEITKSNCVDTSACHQVAFSSLSSILNVSGRAFPNPVENTLNLVLPSGRYFIQVVDLYGQVLIEKELLIIDDLTSIHLEQIVTGNYLLQISDVDRRISGCFRFVKI